MHMFVCIVGHGHTTFVYTNINTFIKNAVKVVKIVSMGEKDRGLL